MRPSKLRTRRSDAGQRDERPWPLARRGRRLSAARQQPGEHVLGALEVLGHRARGAHRVAVAHGCEQPAVLGVGRRQHLGRMRRCRRSGRSSRPAPRSSRAPALGSASPRRARRAGGCRPGGRRGSPRARPRASSDDSSSARGRPAARVRPRARRRRARPPAAGRRSRASARASRRRRVGRRLGVGHERAAVAPARGEDVTALAERGQRLAQRRAGDPQARAQVALGGQARARAAAGRA